MKKSRNIQLLLLLIVAGVAILLLWRRTGSTPTVAVSFQGFTNDSKGLRLATFSISNSSSGSIIRWGHYGVETKVTPWPQATQPHFAPKATLGPGQVESVSLPAPTNLGAWKAVLFFSPDGWRYRSAMNTNSLLMRLTAQKGLSFPTEIQKSDWFDQ